MPSKLKAGGTFPYILEADRSDGGPPQFAIRVLSAFEDGEVAAIRREFVDATGQPAKRTELIEKALLLAVDACHIDGFQNESTWNMLLTSLECWELINAATEGASLTSEERKKFVSPPPCETDSCVGGAGPSA
jgi:hypothetical protein